MKNNNLSVFNTIGARNFAKGEREENDFYATDPLAIDVLLDKEKFCDFILEPCCGMGHLSEKLIKAGYYVTSTDLIDRGYKNAIVQDFRTINKWSGDIITNPPYKYVTEFVKHALEIVPNKNKVAMFLKLLFLESIERYNLFLEHPVKKIYVFSDRIKCYKNADFSMNSGAICYAWFVWEKGYQGSTTIECVLSKEYKDKE